MEDTHVVPIDDLIDHETLRQCLCRPRVVEQSWNTALVLHHSYDAREYWEEDNVPEPPNA